jgi:hypothetical protein
MEPSRIAQHFTRHIPGELESYVYKFYTKRDFWQFVEKSGAVSVIDNDEDEGGEFCVIMFHDAEIATEFGIGIVDEDAAQESK